jgi:hypothetical protein
MHVAIILKAQTVFTGIGLYTISFHGFTMAMSACIELKLAILILLQYFVEVFFAKY